MAHLQHTLRACNAVSSASAACTMGTSKRRGKRQLSSCRSLLDDRLMRVLRGCKWRAPIRWCHVPKLAHAALRPSPSAPPPTPAQRVRHSMRENLWHKDTTSESERRATQRYLTHVFCELAPDPTTKPPGLLERCPHRLSMGSSTKPADTPRASASKSSEGRRSGCDCSHG